MREVLKWNKNHLTGERIEKLVTKPNNQVIGKARVEVYREGNLINETFTENIIPECLHEREWYRIMYHAVLLGNKPTIYGGNTSFYDSSSFKNIVLSANDRNEDKNNLFYDGNIIGWCPKKDTNAGSDVKRGVYNPTESFEEYKDGYFHAHYVYDFGTSQANGTFNSIWWGRSSSNNKVISEFNGVQIGGIGLNREALNNSINSSIATCFENIWYIRTNPTGGSGDGFYRLKNSEAWINSLENPIIDIETYVPLHRLTHIPMRKSAYNENAIIIDNIINTDTENKVTFAVIDKDFNRIKEVQVDLANHEVIGKYTRQTDNKRRLTVDSIRAVHKNGDIEVVLKAWNDYDYRYYKFYKTYNKTNDELTSTVENYGYALGVFNIESGAWTLVPDWDNVTCRRINKEDGLYSEYASLGDRTLMVLYPPDTKGNSNENFYQDIGMAYFTREYPERDYAYIIDKYNMRDFGEFYYYGNAPSFYIQNKIDPDSNVFLLHYHSTSYNGYGRYLDIRHAYSAHTKLPGPVTKTSADTMKIQYDYYIQIPKIWSKDGNLLGYNPPQA